MRKNLLLITFLFLGVRIFAQESSIKEPKFPLPEEALLYFLNSDYFYEPNNLKGNVVTVAISKKDISKKGNILFESTAKIKPAKLSKSTLALLKISNPKDFIGLDSIYKRNNKTFELYTFDPHYEKVIEKTYTFKNGKIVKKDLSALAFLEGERYEYNKQGQLVKIDFSQDNDKNKTEFELATYSKNGKILTQKSFYNKSNLKVTETIYIYENELLKEKTVKKVEYYPKENLKIKVPNKRITFNNYVTNDTVIQEETTTFSYNKANRLILVEKSNKEFSKEKGVLKQHEKTIQLKYNANTLIVTDAEKNKEYEYVFDTYNNIIQIKKYDIRDNQKWLYEQTDFKITYQ